MYINNSKSLKCFLLKCPEEKKEKFKYSEAALLISIGKFYHEGEKSWAMMNFIDKNFKKCNIMVNDSLQRHTIMLEECGNLSIEEAYNRSIKAGQEWVERNYKFIESLSIPYTLYYWDPWLEDKDYIQYRAKINSMWEKDLEFKKNMDITINEFLRRNKEKTEITGLDRAYNICLEYLLEECAVIMGVWQKCNYDFILYPGKIIDIMNYTYSKLVNNDMLFWLHVKFRRNNKDK